MIIESISDSRNDFIKSYLYEMPSGTPPINPILQLINSISELKKYYQIIKLSNNLFKMEGNELVYYWYEENDAILLGAEFTKVKHGIVVNYVAKIEKSTPPYATDLYNDVLNDRKNIEFANNSIIISDKRLSEDGISLWKRLFKKGHTISIYNTEDASNTFTKLNSIEDLESFFKMHDSSYEKYRYILSESGGNYAEVMAFFSLRRLHETSGTL